MITNIEHEQKNPRNEVSHSVSLNTSSLLYQIIKQKKIKVNNSKTEIEVPGYKLADVHNSVADRNYKYFDFDQKFDNLFDYIQGDVNTDGVLNVLDIVLTVNFVLGVDTPSNIQNNLADMNSDGILNVLDVILIVNEVIG